MLTSVLTPMVLAATMAIGSAAGLAEGEVAPGSTVAPESTYESYSTVIVRQIIPGVHRGDWQATCREGFWLDNRVGTPGMSIGQGIKVEGVSDIRAGVVDLLKDGGYVRGMKGYVSNIGFVEQWAKVTMYCTSDPTYAWWG